ncbi:hypothetical protein MCEMSEM22_00159 [Comamonadaceae bacterium]
MKDFVPAFVKVRLSQSGFLPRLSSQASNTLRLVRRFPAIFWHEQMAIG